MNAKPVLFLMGSLFNLFSLNVADRRVGRRFEEKFDNSSLILKAPGVKVRSFMDCGSLCEIASACKTFCYSQSTALCHLSQPYVSSGQNYDVLDSQCYDAICCPTIKGYAWYGARCIKDYVEMKNYVDARAICTQDGGHLYHLKTLEWDLQPIEDLRTAVAGCPMTKGYAWYGARCIKSYGNRMIYADARAICTQDGGHLYHFKTLEWDMQPIVDLRNAVGYLHGGLWVGADDLEVQGQYQWSDSSLLANDSPVWDGGEPNDPDQRCAILWLNNLKLYNDPCINIYMFVCQIDV